MSDYAKKTIWGWWVILGLGICFIISLTYGIWQGNLNQEEKIRLQSDAKQLHTRIAFLEEQIRQANQVAGSGDANLCNNPILQNRQQIYDFLTNKAADSGLVILKLALRPVEADQEVITAEMELGGNYPQAQAFIQQIQAGNFDFVLDKMTMVQNPEPKLSLKLALLMNITIPKGGS